MPAPAAGSSKVRGPVRSALASASHQRNLSDGMRVMVRFNSQVSGVSRALLDMLPMSVVSSAGGVSLPFVSSSESFGVQASHMLSVLLPWLSTIVGSAIVNTSVTQTGSTVGAGRPHDGPVVAEPSSTL